MAKKKALKKFLTKDDILKVEDLPVEEVYVPEWGGSVKVRTMSATERDEYEVSLWTEKDGQLVDRSFENFRAKLVAMTAVDGDGNRLFSLDEAALLGKKSAAALDRLFAVATKLNRISRKDVEDLTKN